MLLRKAWIALALSMTVVAVAFPQEADDTVALDILLTNDDGYDAPGIQAMYQALVDAGHRVTLMAPAEQQSGSSVRWTHGNLTIEQKGDGVWAVWSSPASAVHVALRHIFAERPPDLVVSGSNFGQNLGFTVNTSGTVGAPIMAMYFGVPAIAVSVGLRFEEADSFPSTFAAFEPAAAFTVELIAQLQRTRRVSGRLLPDHTILNVNYPALPPEEIRGLAFTPLGWTSPYLTTYQEADVPGELMQVHQASDFDEPVDYADTTLFAQGYITITLLDGDWTADRMTRTLLSTRLSPLDERIVRK